MMQLQSEQSLVWSTVVANCCMNRERGISGVNSYQKELKFDILAFLEIKAKQAKTVRWIDICCGTGKALVEAAAYLQKGGITNVQIEGWDLAGLFVKEHANYSNLKLVVDSIEKWQPAQGYDLITCVHGLHYIGDKVGLLEKCVRNLTPTGIFLANLDLKNIKMPEGTNWQRQLRKMLQVYGLHYNTKQHLVNCEGQKDIKLNLIYLGANDKAGKNYTGQPVVDSYYQ